MPWLLVLVLVWLLFGVAAGALAHAARWGCAARGLGGPYAVWATIGLGIGGALVGGMLGWLVFGRYFATPTALWVAVLVVTVGPWLGAQMQRRLGDAAQRPPSR